MKIIRKPLSDKVKANQGCKRPSGRTVAHATGTSKGIIPTEGVVIKFDGGGQPAIHARVLLASGQNVRDFLFFLRKGGLMVETLQAYGEVAITGDTSDTYAVGGRGMVWVKLWGAPAAVDHFTRQGICEEWCQPTTTRVSWQGQGSAPAACVRPRRPTQAQMDAIKVEDARAKAACQCKAIVSRIASTSGVEYAKGTDTATRRHHLGI